MSQGWKEIMDLVMEYVLLCEFLGYRYLEGNLKESYLGYQIHMRLELTVVVQVR